jgi:hypothetical protein
MKLIKFIIVNIFFTAISAQETPMLHENSLPGIKKITTRQFDYDGLWGYINGGADLYFEYGFKSVTVQDIKINGSDFKVDIYCMESPEAAYGIYSVSRFRCLSSNIMNRFDCTTPYQYIAARGEYYLSIANNSGSENDQELSRTIAWRYFDIIDTPPLHFSQFFDHPFFEQRWFDLKLIFGPLGMQNGFMRWDRLFAGFNNYKAWVMPVDREDQKCNIGVIQFENSESQKHFIQQNELFIVNSRESLPVPAEKYYAFPMEDGLLLFEGEMSEQLFGELLELSQFKF